MTAKIATADTLRLIEFNGPLDARARYKLELAVPGDLTARHMRNLIKQLTLNVAILEEDETPRPEPAESPHA